MASASLLPMLERSSIMAPALHFGPLQPWSELLSIRAFQRDFSLSFTSVFLYLAGEPQPLEPLCISDQNLCYTEIIHCYFQKNRDYHHHRKSCSQAQSELCSEWFMSVSRLLKFVIQCNFNQQYVLMEWKWRYHPWAPIIFRALVIFYQLKWIFLTYSLNTFQLNFLFYNLPV